MEHQLVQNIHANLERVDSHHQAITACMHSIVELDSQGTNPLGKFLLAAAQIEVLAC